MSNFELNWNTELILEGRVVRLEFLRSEHTAVLWEVAKSSLANIFRYIPRRIRSLREFEKSIESALVERRQRQSIPFVIIEQSSGQAVGMTRFRMFEFEKRRVEIAATWVAPRWQRAGINTEAKYLMLRHAFEQWSCQRVDFRTAESNVESRRSIARIGAKEVGIYAEAFGGRAWSIVHFRIAASEWPAIKAYLEGHLWTF